MDSNIREFTASELTLSEQNLKDLNKCDTKWDRALTIGHLLLSLSENIHGFERSIEPDGEINLDLICNNDIQMKISSELKDWLQTEKIIVRFTTGSIVRQ